MLEMITTISFIFLLVQIPYIYKKTLYFQEQMMCCGIFSCTIASSVNTIYYYIYISMKWLIKVAILLTKNDKYIICRYNLTCIFICWIMPLCVYYELKYVIFFLVQQKHSFSAQLFCIQTILWSDFLILVFCLGLPNPKHYISKSPEAIPDFFL